MTCVITINHKPNIVFIITDDQDVLLNSMVCNIII